MFDGHKTDEKAMLDTSKISSEFPVFSSGQYLTIRLKTFENGESALKILAQATKRGLTCTKLRDNDTSEHQFGNPFADKSWANGVKIMFAGAFQIRFCFVTLGVTVLD